MEPDEYRRRWIGILTALVRSEGREDFLSLFRTVFPPLEVRQPPGLTSEQVESLRTDIMVPINDEVTKMAAGQSQVMVWLLDRLSTVTYKSMEEILHQMALEFERSGPDSNET
ncbi:MAG: hypothetical protein GEV03_22500 [Streptosporangiales bacterium]|nr:hypothetical protein [Streptosporangiales bacterium]